MAIDGWVMIGIMVFVLLAQTALWVWVLLERRSKLSDIDIVNWREMYNSARKAIDEYDKNMRYRKSR
ncbi:MAG: hypothetical protein EI684_05590 [Candidatus Viridilinea halotolerans]|uniref:Uncharacterized protein n=1 Tax=Candidatus Viridilinea halotolerans TaxID=2491704 RepID=A0A426U575_9CHLR|nr:MAG: hypothetical protein EI684_05590 [Candidatus Viridilinea halotolerans]